MRTFQEAYMAKQNLWLRLIDVFAHIFFGILTTLYFHLPWQYALVQLFPDQMLLLMWPYSMITNRWLDDGNILLRIHHALHSFPTFIVSMGAISLLMQLSLYRHLPVLDVHLLFFLWVQWCSHICIDAFTHREELA